MKIKMIQYILSFNLIYGVTILKYKFLIVLSIIFSFVCMIFSGLNFKNNTQDNMGLVVFSAIIGIVLLAIYMLLNRTNK